MTATIIKQTINPKDVLTSYEWQIITNWLNGRSFEIISFSFSNTENGIDWGIEGMVNGFECEIWYENSRLYNPSNKIKFTTLVESPK